MRTVRMIRWVRKAVDTWMKYHIGVVSRKQQFRMNDWPQGQRKAVKDEQEQIKVAECCEIELEHCEYSAPFFYSCYPSRQFSIEVAL
ncbi:hypothetical protein DMH88_15360 [Escherichia coli]|nr:hypothetical protein [Escherichia coli]